MAGILSKDIALGYSASGTSPITYTALTGLMSVPAVGGAAEKVDVTVLADGNYKFINGIKDFGDLEFGFLFDNSTSTSNYRVIRGLEESGDVVYWQLSYPDGTKVAFSGEVSTKIDEKGVNEALTFKATITLNSDLSVTNPV